MRASLAIVVDMPRNVSFKHRDIDLAGHLHVPADFDEQRSYAALVCVHPGSSVKEQTAGLYAARMAERGFVALAFDASFQGESGGEPRFIEDPALRTEDIRCAVDYLTTLAFVDAERIGVLGVCAGGGYALSAAMTDHRIKAIGTVTSAKAGTAFRASGLPDRLRAVGDQRTREARGEPPLVTRWIPNTPEELAATGSRELDLCEAVEYYRTPRGQHPRSTNQLRLSQLGGLLGYDAFHLVEELLTQPLQIIVGDRVGAFGAYAAGHELYQRATCEKDLFVVHGASHYDLYDRPEYVGQAVDKLDAFYTRHLAS